MNLRLGLDAKRLFHNKTGLGNYSRTLVRNLIRYNPDYEFYLYTPGISEEFKDLDFLSEPNVTVRDISSLFGWKRSLGLVRILERDGIRLYHGLSNELPYGIHNSYINSVVTIHDLIFLRYPETYPLIDRWIYNRKSKYACKAANLVHAISDATAKDIHLYYGTEKDKIRTVYQTIDPLYWSPLSAGQTREVVDDNYFLYVGSIIERKNLLQMIDAMHALDSETFSLVVVGHGSGKYFNEVKSKIEEYHLQDRIIFYSESVDTVAIKNLYANAIGLVFTSRCEGFGLPNLEAALMSTPIITSDVSALPESSGPYATKVNPDSLEELARALLDIIKSDQSKAVSSTRNWALEMFDPENVTRDLTKLYREIK